MTKFKFIIITFSFLILLADFSYSQGCSDAGICTMNSFKPNNSDVITKLNNQVKIGAFFGKADNSISVFGNYIEYNRKLSENFGVDIKLTALGQNGNGISEYGFSDAFVNANYKVNDKLRLTLGTKIPLSNSNKTENNLPLPMDYQSSLGTFDLIFGVGFEYNKIQFVAAVQQPLTQNDNQFLASTYPLDSKFRDFPSTNKFKRSGDVMLRVSYPISVSHNFKLTPSILPIYHIANDKYTDGLNVEREISGSQGLTLNGNVYLDYIINSKNILQLNFALPFVIRDSRPDGLTRSFVANLEYRILF